MYLTLRRIPVPRSAAPPVDSASAVPARRQRVSSVVLTLGTVSLLTDLSSEMVLAVLPVYLTAVLGLTPLQFGVVDGVYQGVTAAVRIFGGLTADLTRRPKLVATVGYSLSCGCKLLFLPVQGFAAVTGLVALDRAGKGIRTAPRDAMIAAASPPRELGRAFGVHRAMDTVGALGGPLIAFGVLAVLVDGYQLIFALSFSLALVAVAVLALFAPADRPRRGGGRDPDLDVSATAVESPLPTPDEHGQASPGPVGRQVAGLGRAAAYRRVLAVGGLLSLATISDGFVYLALSERVELPVWLFPLFFVGTAAGYLLLAVPLGRLADRVGRGRVFLAGHVVAATGYLGLWLLPRSVPPVPLVLGVLVLVGVYYAATDGVLPALVVPLVPEAVRATGIAGVQAVTALGALVSAAGFGAVWTAFGLDAAVATHALALLAATALAAGVREFRSPVLPHPTGRNR